MKERLKYYILKEKLFVFDTSSTFIVYWEDNDWHEECNLNIDTLKVNNEISEKEALKITAGNSPLQYIEELIKQDMLKNIYCP